MDIYNTILTIIILPTILLFMYMIFRFLDMMNPNINLNDTYRLIDRISDLEQDVNKLKDQLNNRR